MHDPQIAQGTKSFDRRQFMRLAVLGTAGAAVWALLRGGLSLRKERRAISPNIPGEGSIFQPRDDPRTRSK